MGICQLGLHLANDGGHTRGMETQTVTTASGSKYIICGGDTITRLSEVPMHDGNGKATDTVLWAETLEALQPIEVGLPLRAEVLGKPLITTPVTSVEWDWGF